MMTKGNARYRILTTAILFLLMTLTANAVHRGVGCWRSLPRRHAAKARLLSPRPAADNQAEGFVGEKRGLVILAEFTDKTFKAGHDRQKYDDILNMPGYTTSEGFRGSVADYFRDQSAGLFNLTFDVVGPFTSKKDYKYYGENDSNGYDKRPEELIAEMCLAADSLVDFKDYDWDGDGWVDEVFVVYAGKGEADGGGTNTIWPHMWMMDEYMGKELVLDSVHINIYACSNELSFRGRIEGIGTFCHEFSHCLGLPDFYDTVDDANITYGMSDFDLMSGGNYAGDSFCPVGYTAYEKMVCGWQQPIILGDENVEVEGLKPISEDGDTYIIYNDGHPDEYYLIENRQRSGWDTYFPDKGLMITHVDYDAEVWENNIPNTIVPDSLVKEYELTCSNDHERMTFFHANNSKTSGKLYPYVRGYAAISPADSLTANSKPAATFYNDNSSGTKFLLGGIRDISQNADGTMSFSYSAPPRPVAIRQVTAEEKETAPIYDLQGRRVNGTIGHGVYIIGGRKVVR